MDDMKAAIVPKSSQTNADDLLTGPITVKIVGVSVKAGQEQPVSIEYEGGEGRPYKPCKSMARAMVHAWGADSSKYVGRFLTLFNDPKVKWGGLEVGGIRISHMSHIDAPITMALTASKGSKKLFTVKPLSTASATTTASPPPVGGADAVEFITADQALTLETRCDENGIDKKRLLLAAKVERLSMIKSADYGRAAKWLDSAIAKAKEAE